MIASSLKKHVAAGLIILLPIAITYWIIKFILNLITHPFEEFVQLALTRLHILNDGFGIFTHEQIILVLSKILVVISLVALILLVGMIGRWFFFRSFIHLADSLLHKIPVVNKVYLACKDFTTALFSPKEGSFSQVVLVPFPSADHLSVGLVTSEFKNEILNNRQDDFISVLIPGTPNPTIGFLLMFSKKQVIFTDMKVDEAIKYVMSCGSVVPPSLSKQSLGLIE